MKTVKKCMLALIVGTVLMSCDQDNEIEAPVITPIDEEAIVEELSRPQPDLASIRRRGVVVTQSPVLRATDLQPVGMSYLIRHRTGVLTLLKSKDLEPGTANTLWWVFFNNPENCTGECDDPDLLVPEVRADVMYADGEIVKSNGQTIFVGRRRLEELDGSVASILWGGPAIGLENTRSTEVHLVVRSHGPVIPGLEDAMIHTFNGGCQGFPPEAGTPGPNECVDIQFATHQPI